MRTALVSFEGVSPYSASRVVESEREKKESYDAFEQRTWRERLNVDRDGNGIIPGPAFKAMIAVAAQRYAGKIRGEGNATWFKFFDAGILVVDGLKLGVTRESVQSEKLFVPSDGKRGGGKRVWKWFPIVHKWGGTIAFQILDDKITEEIFEQTIEQSFAFVGLGRWRPEKGGGNGRANVTKVQWK